MSEEMTVEVREQANESVEIHMQLDEILKDVDVYPFIRKVWHGQQFKDHWGPILKRAASIHDKAEYEMVKRGHRKAATLHMSYSNYDKKIAQIQEDGLVWLPIIRTKTYGGFSHKHFPTDETDINSSTYGVLACDLTAAKMFKKASETPTDHDVIGELLGFPKCCRDFFNDIWMGGFYDPIWQAAERTKGVKYVNPQHAVVQGSILCVQSLRYAGFRVTSHLPCSFSCEPTREIGMKWFETMLDIDLEATLALLRILSSAHQWSVLHGVAIIEHPAFTLWTNSMATKTKWTIDYSPMDYIELISVAKQFEEGGCRGRQGYGCS